MKYNNYMKFAIDEAKTAYSTDEVPVGAVIVRNGEIISRAHNMCEKNNVLYHAELIAINEALNKLKARYLDDCELYVTLEPCAMCAGAIIHSRIKRVYIGALDVKEGFCNSNGNLFQNAKTELYFGINEEECKSLLKSFFAQKR